VRPDLKNGIIHVYFFSKHNHPMISEGKLLYCGFFKFYSKITEKRAIFIRAKKLMRDANPPAIFRTMDNSEWKFLQTVPNFGKLQKFRRNKHCYPTNGDAKSGRIRFYCNCLSSHKCQFKLVAMKTTKKGYHVYKRGKHNHPAAPKSSINRK
jgi:hypothetical protein